MRLTLRTLMAWMDDTLPPKDVRRIGRQLERSKFSQDLSRRIRRVVRQRRLTVPGMGSNQPVDANIVAAYLDNNLPVEATNTFESLCLNSDVHLAEVAATHQILSVLDQPGSISPESFATMYRIVKAPEARILSDRRLPPRNSPEPTRAANGSVEAGRAASDWPIPPFAKNARRFIAACVLTGTLLAFAGLALDRIVGPVAPIAPAARVPQETIAESDSAQGPTDQAQAPLSSDAPQPAERAEAIVKVPPEIATAEPEKAAPVEAKSEITTPKIEIKEASAKDSKVTMPETLKATAPEPGKESSAPNGAGQNGGFIELPEIAAIADTTILFTTPKDDTPTRAWSFWKFPPDLPCLVRFAGADTAKVISGSLSYDIAPGSLMEMPENGPPTWLAGRADASANSAGMARFRTGSGREISVKYAADAKFRIETHSDPKENAGIEPANADKNLVIRALVGTLAVKVGRSEVEITENHAIRIDMSGSVSEIEAALATARSTGSETPASSLVTRMMRRYLGTNRPVATSLIDAESDDLPDVRSLAMRIALWIDREDIVTGVLTDLENPDLRKSAVAALREALANGESSALRTVRGCIEELTLGDTDSDLLKSLLVVPAGEESLERKRALVKALEHDARLIRQLAIDRLMQVSGRDSMGFDPDEPTAKGIEAWRAWIGMDPRGPRQ